MAKKVESIILGIDVSKDELVVCHWATQELIRLANQPEAVHTWLKSLHGPVRIALEPTSSYHLLVLEQALARGHEVFPVNPRQLAHYREAVNLRNKTDPQDAWLLARYLAHEGEQLRPFRPHTRKAHELWALLKRRAVLAKAQTQLRQSLAGLKLPSRPLWQQLQRLLRDIDQRMLKLIRELGWWEDYQRCLSIPGVGPLSAAALVTAFRRGAFSNANAFIAFIGFDVRLRESGKFKGKRKLTKRGEAEVRRLLYCASKAARSYAPFDAYCQRQLDKGLAKIPARVTLARKLARIAFSLLTHQQNFKREILACQGS